MTRGQPDVAALAASLSEGMDAGNTLLDVSPCQAQAGRLRGPDGRQWVVWTERTPTTTLTVFLDKATAKAWGEKLIEAAGGMSALVTGNGYGAGG